MEGANIYKKIAGTGHRTDKFKWFNKNLSYIENEQAPECLLIKSMLEETIRDLITNEGYNYFISGMALGFDTWLAECVINLKREFPNIMLEAAIPCLDQEKAWPDINDQIRYHNILSNCDVITYVSKTKYSPYLMIKRNEYMIDHCDNKVLACYDGTDGGTRRAYIYAMKMHMTIINIDPVTMQKKIVKF